MQNRVDYLIKDNLCKKAIEVYNAHASLHDWLNQYSELYNSVTIKPEGLPPVTSSHFEGELFENIKQFVEIYSMVR